MVLSTFLKDYLKKLELDQKARIDLHFLWQEIELKNNGPTLFK